MVLFVLFQHVLNITFIPLPYYICLFRFTSLIYPNSIWLCLEHSTSNFFWFQGFYLVFQMLSSKGFSRHNSCIGLLFFIHPGFVDFASYFYCWLVFLWCRYFHSYYFEITQFDEGKFYTNFFYRIRVRDRNRTCKHVALPSFQHEYVNNF